MKNARYYILIGIFLISILGLILGVKYFFMSLHWIDYGQNIIALNSAYQHNLIDLGKDGGLRSGIQVYQMGLSGLENSLSLIIFFTFTFGFTLAFILKNSDEFYKGVKKWGKQK